MKTLEFIYQETAIQFLLNPLDDNVMVNATEMAKIFNKDVREFLKLNSTKNYLKCKLEKLNNDGNSHHYNEDYLVKSNKKAGTLMLRPLALKFAAWLDVDFEIWVFDTIDNLIFGNYKKHWEAHARQEEAEKEMKSLKRKLLTTNNPDKQDVVDYFFAEKSFNEAKKDKSKAIRNQLKLF